MCDAKIYVYGFTTKINTFNFAIFSYTSIFRSGLQLDNEYAEF